MYLKNIRAYGFKSFADKIDLEIKKGITAIVGPNGSGKSNIVDAVRWVLGEQSVKSLRGSDTMSDVIFSGSKTRQPQTRAYVALVFDNTDFSNFDELIKPLSINGLIISDKNKLNNYNKNAQLNIYCLEALYFNEFPAVAGIISDVANIDYQIVVQTLKNSKKQLKFYHTLLHLLNQTSLSTSIKYCLKQQQGFSNQTRLPLTKIDSKLENKLNQVLEKTK